MRISHKIVINLLLVVILLAGVSPVFAESSKNGTHQVVRETVTWTMDSCQSINVVVTGTGQRHEEITTQVYKDGSSRIVINDLVIGNASDNNGATYRFYYVNHSSQNVPASGAPISIKMDDLFLLKGNSSSANNLHVAFVWSWTFNPPASYWPPVDNWAKTYTLGDPITCDPI